MDHNPKIIIFSFGYYFFFFFLVYYEIEFRLNITFIRVIYNIKPDGQGKIIPKL